MGNYYIVTGSYWGYIRMGCVDTSLHDLAIAIREASEV